MQTIFLCGPMRGVSRQYALEWRNKAHDLLGNSFYVLHALRGREERETLPDPRLAVARDKADILRSDIVLVDDSQPNVSMIGTAMEIIFAHSHNKVVIAFGDAHPEDYWLNFHIHGRTDTLEQACELISAKFSL